MKAEKENRRSEKENPAPRQTPEKEAKNPFKETSTTEPAETPEEEAAAEQQRKEALTERD